MKKRASYFVYLGWFIIIVLLLIGVIGWRFSYRSQKCTDFTESLVNLDMDLLIRFSDDAVDEVVIYIKSQSGSYKLKITGDQWLRIYFGQVRTVQVKYLLRLDDNAQQADLCKITRILEYSTGIPFENIYYFKDGKYYSSSPIRLLYWIILDKAHKVTQLKIKPKDKFTLEDGSQVDVLTYSDIFDKVKNILSLEEVQKEGIFVEIYNATDKAGYATYWARRLKTLGFLISRAGNYPQLDVSQDMYVYISPSVQESTTAKTLKSLLKNKNVYWADKRPKYLLTTSEIVIILLR